MEKRVSKEEIVTMHMEQQLERKKALLVKLGLQEGKSVDEIVKASEGIITKEDCQRYGTENRVSSLFDDFPKQMNLPNIFRGENACYPTGKSTYYRDGLVQRKETSRKEQIRQMIAECSTQTAPVIPGIAEAHYGISSEWIGFTSNFDEALFYACCTVDEQSGKWRPLDKNDFVASDSSGGADHHYGVIYMADAADDRLWEEAEYNRMIPSGSQPLMRNVMQYAYAMRLGSEDDLVRDERFVRLIFEHSEELCRDIYERMEQGKYLFRKDQ